MNKFVVPEGFNRKGLSVSEAIVLDVLIDKTLGEETAIKSTYFSDTFGIHRCNLAKSVSKLRSKGIPICSSKTGEFKGYFMPKRKSELTNTMQDFEQQACKMIDIIDSLWKAEKKLSLE